MKTIFFGIVLSLQSPVTMGTSFFTQHNRLPSYITHNTIHIDYKMMTTKWTEIQPFVCVNIPAGLKAVSPLQCQAITCVSLHPPGLELDDRVGEDALVLFQAALANIATHVHLTQHAQWTDFGVVVSGTLPDKHQAPEQWRVTRLLLVTKRRIGYKREAASFKHPHTHLLASKVWCALALEQ